MNGVSLKFQGVFQDTAVGHGPASHSKHLLPAVVQPSQLLQIVPADGPYRVQIKPALDGRLLKELVASDDGTVRACGKAHTQGLNMAA